MEDILLNFQDMKEHIAGLSDEAAAMLVLALAIKEAATFSPKNAEQFGHELSLALKNALLEGPPLRVTEGE